MKVEVQLMSQQGRYVTPAARRASRKFKGHLALGEERVNELGRTTLLAHLWSAEDTAPLAVLPVLHDASVVHVERSRLRIRGFEIVNGTQMGQTWDVQVVAC